MYAFTDYYFPKLFNYISKMYVLSDLLEFRRGILLNIEEPDPLIIVYLRISWLEHFYFVIQTIAQHLLSGVKTFLETPTKLLAV